jgi:ABC-type antimicrobial peptide transport system permease subunit
MPEDKFSDGMIVGLIIGILVGIPVGWILAQTIFKPSVATGPSSVIFDRDQENRISAIHYVPGMGTGEAAR